MSEPFRSLESFERELRGCNDYKDVFKVALTGLKNNTFTRSLGNIHTTNLPTLKLCNSHAYETIKDPEIRVALAKSELFQFVQHGGLRASEDLEIHWDRRPEIHRFLHAVLALATCQYSTISPPNGYGIQPYMGVEAVKVFLRAINLVIEEIKKSDWERFDSLHKIAHGMKRTYGTPLDGIRTCSIDLHSSLTKTLWRIRDERGQ